jgi:predicted glutamine amidotransferase
MCRWLSYTGSAVLLDELLYKPEHSLIVQSLHATMGAETTNGDGFGVGWYGAQATPGVFHLALTFGLEDDPPGAVERAVGLVEATGRRHGVEHPIQMTVATSDGERLWAFRYSSEGRSRSLFHSTDVRTLRHQYPDNPVLHAVSDQTRLVVSEPLGDLKGAWRAVPEATSVLIEGGREELRPFTPRPGRSGATVTGG